MKKQIFHYLKRKGFTNTNKVNSLFVSAFVIKNGWNISNNSFLLGLMLPINDYELSDFLDALVINECDFSLEELNKLFEYVISPEDRIITGAIYTPKDIRTFIINQVLSRFSVNELEDIKVGDISCGCGSFLVDVASTIHELTGNSYKYIIEHQIFGVDIQIYSVERTKIMLSLLALKEGEDENFDFNIERGNSIVYDFNSFDGLDAIVGNPPYVCSRNMDSNTKSELGRWSVCASGHPDLYIPFFQIALENLNDRGVLGYITMNSFIKSLNGRALRQYFQDNSYNFDLIDFRSRQIFGSKSTYTCICIIQKENSEFIRYGTNEVGSLTSVPTFSEVKYASMNAKTGWNLYNNEYNSGLEAVGIPLGKYCQSRHGIATLSNKTYIFKPKKEDSEFYYFQKNGIDYRVECGICRDIINSNRMTKEIDFEKVLEKVIFPYTNDDHPLILEEAELKSNFPEAYNYLLSQKKVLLNRDKKKGKNYRHWYEYGRTQCLERIKAKLFFPKLANEPPKCVLREDANILFYNGQAFISDDVNKLLVVKKVLESDIFWSYIKATSKPYCSNYYCLNGNYIKNFGVTNVE